MDAIETISHHSLLSAGYSPSEPDDENNRFYAKGKLSVFYCEVDRAYYLNHLYPFDFLLNSMGQLEALGQVLNGKLTHLEECL